MPDAYPFALFSVAFSAFDADDPVSVRRVPKCQSSEFYQKQHFQADGLAIVVTRKMLRR
jgi:hypothetical protein